MSFLREIVRDLWRKIPDFIKPKIMWQVASFCSSKWNEHLPNQAPITVAYQTAKTVRTNAVNANPLHPKIFIDCGFNDGRILETFVKVMGKKFQFYGFEVNENRFAEAAERLQRKHPNIAGLHFKAVSNKDGIANFCAMGDPNPDHWPLQETSIVGSMIEGKPDGIKYASGQVPEIDFSQWLLELCKDFNGAGKPYVAVKMDIEGAEYQVLEKMIQDGTIHLIDELIIEFHTAQFHPDSIRTCMQHRENEIRRSLGKTNVIVHEWF